MRHIAFISKKGGVGKSTLTCALGLYLAERAGKRVAVLDMEKDGGSSAFVQYANHERLTEYEHGQVYDYVLIDTEGNVKGDELEAVESQADMVIIPLEITPLEIAKTYETQEALKQPQKARLLINRVRVNTTAWKGKDDNLEAITIKPLETFIKKRTAYARFMVEGWPALNSDAIQELERLAWEVAG